MTVRATARLRGRQSAEGTSAVKETSRLAAEGMVAPLAMLSDIRQGISHDRPRLFEQLTCGLPNQQLGRVQRGRVPALQEPGKMLPERILQVRRLRIAVVSLAWRTNCHRATAVPLAWRTNCHRASAVPLASRTNCHREKRLPPLWSCNAQLLGWRLAVSASLIVRHSLSSVKVWPAAMRSDPLPDSVSEPSAVLVGMQGAGRGLLQSPPQKVWLASLELLEEQPMNPTVWL
jgi:hypothetical protein